jgi:Type III secretion protein YscO
MIDKLNMLLKVKKLKEAEALKLMQMQRVKEREARSAADRSRIIVEENAATLEPRSDALYAEIMGKTIDLTCLDELKLRLVAMQKEHDRLKDKLQRDELAHEKADSALKLAIRDHDERVRASQKYEILTDDLMGTIIRQREHAEEAEIEDRTTRGRRPE